MATKSKGTRLYRLISRLVSSLSWENIQVLGKIIGIIGWFLAFNRRKLVVENLKKCCGVDDISALNTSLSTFISFGRSLCELFAISSLQKDEIKRIMPLKGVKNLENSIKENGAILFTGHFGSWELLGATISAHDIPMMTIVKRQSNHSFDRWLLNQRKKLKIKTIYRGESIRPLVEWLKKGKMISILMDQDAGNKGAFVPFFGQIASTPTGAAALALKLDIPLLPLYSYRKKDGSHIGFIGKPLALKFDNSANKNENITKACYKMNQSLEKIIRKRPQQWLWLHKRFKTQPK